jgi:hypothetical protein
LFEKEDARIRQVRRDIVTKLLGHGGLREFIRGLMVVSRREVLFDN